MTPKKPKLKMFLCSCTREIMEIPVSARFSDCPDLGGWYFNCICGTTIFIGNHDSDRIADDNEVSAT